MSASPTTNGAPVEHGAVRDPTTGEATSLEWRPAAACALRAEGLVVRRGDRLVLDHVDVAADPGELVALVGPNGAGKSTALAALSGDLVPSAGTIRLDDRPLSDLTALEAARLRAVLPQHPTVTFPFTVDDVVGMGRAPWHRQPEAAENRSAVDDAMALADVSHLAHRSVRTLSGGEAARVALARVLAQRTAVVLLDEPTAALDVHQQELSMRAVRHRVDAGATAVVVLHDLALAAAYADRIVVLDHGRVAGSGSASDVLDGDLLSAVYRHPIEVIPHPRTGQPLVLTRR